MADLLGSILSSMEKPPSLGDQETRRKARESHLQQARRTTVQPKPSIITGSCTQNVWGSLGMQTGPCHVSPEQAARLKKLQEQEKQQKVEFRKRMEKEVSDFIQDSGQIKKKFQPMNKIERSILHDVVEVAGLTSFSFGEDDECRYVMIFKKEFAPSDEELDSYRRGEEWDPQKAEEKRKLKELAQRQEEEAAQRGPVEVSPASDYKDKYSHLIGKGAAKDAAHMLQANKTYGCVPVANKRDTRSIEEAMNEIRAKKRLRQSGEELPPTS
ncbi:sperm-associated antigen 7 isoform X1 [Tupaia chinensis]|uniref:sperm-associated antigen 7 isoform X1 n=1 Tax=Tupaia chinensis TaxID=246437 RepID=UPI0007044B1D|nr:sperm-associated antigen 7 isoform X1 [Tupaia chinensis]